MIPGERWRGRHRARSRLCSTTFGTPTCTLHSCEYTSLFNIQDVFQYSFGRFFLWSFSQSRETRKVHRDRRGHAEVHVKRVVCVKAWSCRLRLRGGSRTGIQHRRYVSLPWRRDRGVCEVNDSFPVYRFAARGKVWIHALQMRRPWLDFQRRHGRLSGTSNRAIDDASITEKDILQERLGTSERGRVILRLPPFAFAVVRRASYGRRLLRYRRR